MNQSENKELQANAAIGEAINSAREHLPEGYSIVINLECGAGTVELNDPSGCIVDFCEDGTFADQINEAVKAAMGGN